MSTSFSLLRILLAVFSFQMAFLEGFEHPKLERLIDWPYDRDGNPETDDGWK